MNLGHWQKLQKVHIQSLSIAGAEIELSFALWAAVSEMQVNFPKLPCRLCSLYFTSLYFKTSLDETT